MHAYYLLAKEKVPHVAIVFSFQCTKKSNGEFSNFAELVQRRCSWQMARNINNVTIKWTNKQRTGGSDQKGVSLKCFAISL